MESIFEKQNDSIDKSSENLCCICQRSLSSDEKSLHRKLIRRCATEFMCIECMAKHFNVSVELLKQKIEFFKSHGCTLF